MKQPLYILITMLFFLACKKKESSPVQHILNGTDTTEIGIPVSDTNTLIRYRFIGIVNQHIQYFDPIVKVWDTVYADTLNALVRYNDSLFFTYNDIKAFPSDRIWIDSFQWNQNGIYKGKYNDGDFIYIGDSITHKKVYGSPGRVSNYIFRGKNDLQ